MQDIKDRIKAVRQSEKVNLSQTAFGERLGVTAAGVSRVESGQRNPSEQVILSICREYGVNEKWLRTGEGEMFVASADDSLRGIVREFGLDDDDYYVLSEFVQLPPAERKAVISYMRRVVARIDGMKPEGNRSAEAGERPRAPREMTEEELHAELSRQFRDGKTTAGEGSRSVG